jgi:hypothetical protein
MGLAPEPPAGPCLALDRCARPVGPCRGVARKRDERPAQVRYKACPPRFAQVRWRGSGVC